MTSRLVVVWLLVASLFVFEMGCGTLLRLFSSDREQNVESDQKPGAEASGGSSIWQFNFQNVAGKGGWALLPFILGAWFVRSRRLRGGLDTVIESIREKQCEDCKRCVESRNNAVVNRRVRVLKKKWKIEACR